MKEEKRNNLQCFGIVIVNVSHNSPLLYEYKCMWMRRNGTSEICQKTLCKSITLFSRHQWHRREKTLTSKQWQNTRSDVIRDDVIRIMSGLIPDKGLNHLDLISSSAHFTSRVCDIWIMVLVLDKCYDNRHFMSFGPHYRSCMRSHSRAVLCQVNAWIS